LLSMKKTSFIQKLLLFIFGVILAVIFLEAGLRIAGGIVLYLQDRHNHVSFHSNEYRILCLGESTTALGGEDSYPSQLEEMLNAQSRQIKYTVINKGIISTTSKYILEHIDQNLDRYKPQMVVVMMGINDKAYLHDTDRSLWHGNVRSFIRDLKVYKLARLLYAHIAHKIKGTNAPAQAVDGEPSGGNYNQVENFLKVVIVQSIENYRQHMARHEIQLAKESMMGASLACVELVRRYRLQGHFEEARSILNEALIIDPRSSEVYLEWGELNLAQKKGDLALKAFQSAFALDLKNSDALLGLARAYHQLHNDNAFLVYAGYLQIEPKDYWGYMELAQWFKEDKHYEMAEYYLSRAIKIEPDFDQAYTDLGQVLDDQGQYQKEEAFYLNEISRYPKSLHPQSSRFYKALGQFYQRQGRDDLAKKYFQQAAQQGMAEYSSVTLINYSLLVDKILNRHIKVVVMQYPVRDISPLRDYLGQRKGVIFLENKQNFKEAMAQGGYWHYFKDNFAYDFGHCTREGNELIARNVTGVILKNE
jgi:tetratricopeptide (TPR) repeat protein